MIRRQPDTVTSGDATCHPSHADAALSVLRRQGAEAAGA
jgi:hypothetical protein